MKIPEFATRKGLFDYLTANKNDLIAAKKATIKHADAISFAPSFVYKKLFTDKQEPEITPELPNNLQVVCIINTTNIVDSHSDVHLPGIWGKSLLENKFIMHLQEHEMEFEKIISSGTDLKAYAKNFTWNELGFSYEGQTEALVFESNIRKDRNAYMLDQYRKGFVVNHSVGMRYIKITLCISDENYGAEYEMWQKYRPMIVNGDMADEIGYFWAVKEAKVIEGSAVPLGSNLATPTLEVKSQPLEGTGKTIPEPLEGTQFKEMLNEFKIF
jgi:hypothetical protein